MMKSWGIKVLETRGDKGYRIRVVVNKSVT